MSVPKLTESIVQARATQESFKRGREYYEAGAIFNAALQGDVLLGECEGSSAPSNRVRVPLAELLADLDRDDLVALPEKLLNEKPDEQRRAE